VNERLVPDGFALGFAGSGKSLYCVAILEFVPDRQLPSRFTVKPKSPKDLMETRHCGRRQMIIRGTDVSVGGFRPRASPVALLATAANTHTLPCDSSPDATAITASAWQQSIPTEAMQSFERISPFGLARDPADVPPPAHELIYSNL